MTKHVALTARAAKTAGTAHARTIWQRQFSLS